MEVTIENEIVGVTVEGAFAEKLFGTLTMAQELDLPHNPTSIQYVCGKRFHAILQSRLSQGPDDKVHLESGHPQFMGNNYGTKIGTP